MAVARSTVEFVARQMGCRPEEVLVASTGVIGVDLSLEKVQDGVTKAMPRSAATHIATRCWQS